MRILREIADEVQHFSFKFLWEVFHHFDDLLFVVVHCVLTLPTGILIQAVKILILMTDDRRLLYSEVGNTY